MKLTIGMAHWHDFPGVQSTIQSLRLHHGCDRDVEFLVVDNSPASPHSKQVEGLLKAVGRYVPLPSPVGTSAPRDLVFREARGDVVMCIDCHVLLALGSIAALMRWFDEHPDSGDLVSGPMLYDWLINPETHMDMRWGDGMLGVWSHAWRCPCGSAYVVGWGRKGRVAFHRLMSHETVVEGKCEGCGSPLPEALQEGDLLKAGWTRMGAKADDEPFEIPGMGLGLFACRREAWLGFNPQFAGFGGEEGYIHEKFRRAGRRCMCLPGVRWLHRWANPGMPPFPNAWYTRARNYIIGRLELGLPYDDVHRHFVEEKRYLSQQMWDYLAADPIGRRDEAGCGCGGTLNQPPATIEEVFRQVATRPSPINEHVPKLREMAAQCDTVVEIAHQRALSCVVFMAAGPKHLHTIDRNSEPALAHLDRLKGVVDFHSVQADGAEVDVPECDLLFIDPEDHSAEYTGRLLERHAGKVRRWIAFHDTMIFGEKFQERAGILPALRRFLIGHGEWSVVYHAPNNYGLTVIGRLDTDKPKLPSVPRLAWNFAKALSAHIAAGMPTASDELVRARLDACLLCVHRVNNRCSACGCWLDEKPDGSAGKAVWADSVCSFALWPGDRERTEVGQPPPAHAFDAIYYSHNQGSPKLLDECLRRQQEAVANARGRLITVTHSKVERGDVRIIRLAPPGHMSIYLQMLAGLAHCRPDAVVMLLEHDVLYPPGYFEGMLEAVRANSGRLVYNRNVWHLTPSGYLQTDPGHHFMSNLASVASNLAKWIKIKMDECGQSPNHCPAWAEPGIDRDGREVPDQVASVRLPVPTLDVRHGYNFTGARGDENSRYEPTLDHWGPAVDLLKELSL